MTDNIKKDIPEPDNFVEELEFMKERFRRKRHLHQRSFRMFKNRDLHLFVIPLMVIQLLNTVIPQFAQIYPDSKYSTILTVLASFLSAVSVVWLGFQAKLRHAELSDGHKNAASMYQHLAVLAIVEKQKANINKDYDKEKFFTFLADIQSLEQKTKDDEYMVPQKIQEKRKNWEKELEQNKRDSNKSDIERAAIENIYNDEEEVKDEEYTRGF